MAAAVAMGLAKIVFPRPTQLQNFDVLPSRKYALDVAFGQNPSGYKLDLGILTHIPWGRSAPGTRST